MVVVSTEMLMCLLTNCSFFTWLSWLNSVWFLLGVVRLSLNVTL